MKSLLKFSLVLTALILSFTAFSQGTLKGTIIDIANNEGLPGASVTVVGTTTGAITDMNGTFSFEAPASGKVEIKFVGYKTITRAFAVASGETTNLGKIGMAASSTLLGDIVIVGVADVARERETPVAVSTIRAAEIQEKLGSQEFPELLNNTPSVYATKQGGGFGDARINIRGFSQENIAVMINGVPVNDMESGAVYWSNWSGLSDVTTAMQVQRGLGSSKLAISSVGGTINILTKTTDAKKGGRIGLNIGNDGYNKMLVSYSTGKMDNNLAVSALFSRTAGNGYVDGTKFRGTNYFFGVGYQPNKKNDFQFTVTGAPQWHHQRSYAPSISKYLGTETEPDIRYNGDWGTLDGEEFSFRRNFYHKPVAALNWDLNLSEKSKISTAFYASVGRGGGTGEIGRINGTRQYALPTNTDGGVDVDNIQNWNSGGVTPEFISSFDDDETDVREQFNGGNYNTGNNGHPSGGGKYGHDNGITRRASMNSHNWIGTISNFNTKLSDNLSFDFGVDLRKYTGIHYRRVENLLGADGYIDYDNTNFDNSSLTDAGGVLVTETYAADFSSLLNVFANVDDEQKIDYHNDGKVNWLGAFTQLEYKINRVTAFVQAGVSQQGFQRIDYFNYLDSDAEQTSGWEQILGGNIKGGLNFNIDDNNNIFFNTGFYSKQPNFRSVYPNYTTNDVNEDLINEKIVGMEIGYGFKSNDKKFTANVNLYRTTWTDRFISLSQNIQINDSTEVRGVARITGVKEIHSGVEFDANYRINDMFQLRGMFSMGDWKYANDVDFEFNNDAQEVIEVGTLYLKDVKVGDAAQTTARLGLDIRPTKDFKVDFNWRTASKIYADIDALSFSQEDHKGSLLLPSYSLLDAGLSYTLRFGDNDGQSLGFRLNANNLLDTKYISESETNIHAEDGSELYNGLDTSNRVFFGLGRTWNFGVNYRF